MFIKKEKGLTLVEVLIAMAFIALVFSYVVQVFFQGFKTMNMGDIESEGIRLAQNEMKKAASMENPLFIGFQDDPLGQQLMQDIKEGKKFPIELVEDGLVTLKQRERVKEETASDSEEIRKSSVGRASFSRSTDWMVEDIEPVLVHVWVTVTWEDERKEYKSGEYTLETLLAP
jgi:prepilin-type N-terminal cleavage/methylation domain-containing protein